ncbi:hypothetical protein QBC46DRAFT_435648 [Diplogelasinospora grovesii]|uniref:chitinase n=1 Tax=Diplogelasinospora grovesii TaxID=303347 RepID=A0AAN6S937_9PEZI|nr:hypothetical protein QBC46DRAFT_435648 [Diplogelasinospora grovesii]
MRSLSKAASAVLLACLALPAQAAQDVDGTPITVAGTGNVPVDVPATYYTQLHPCPKACSQKKSPQDWTLYSSLERLVFCDQPMLVDFAVFNPLDEPTTNVMLKACTLGNEANTHSNPLFNGTGSGAAAKASRADAPVAECMHTGTASKADFELLRTGSSSAADAGILAVLSGLEGSFNDAIFCDRSTLFGYVNGAAVGLYVGNAFGKATITSAIDSLTSEIKQHGYSAGMQAQFCSTGSGAGANQAVVGISIDSRGAKSLAAVQQDVAAWAQGNTAGTNSTLSGNSTHHARHVRGRGAHQQMHELQRRGDCTTIKVGSGDSCGSLASRCGISASDFTKYNPASDLCSTLQPNQKVCCTAGTIPTPQENANGTCATYRIQSEDTCSAIALSNGLKATDIDKFNTGKTWGWTNCTNIQAGLNICLSDGTAPLPAPYDNAICGPIMPGTTYPTDGTNITDLNPCPLNACCNVWGQCGITPDFCTEYQSPTNNPGYSPPGKNGCISNCGIEIKNKDTAPPSFQRVGYWESWNLDRPCLNLQAKHANTDGSYTHIHWAFATIDSTFSPVVNDTFKQWADFVAMTDVKRVISFGGWGYSTDPATYDALRSAISPANRNTFATNIVNFLNANNLDGVDIDWEYPGAPDIPGIPPGQKDDGANYLKFLATLKSKLPSGKSLSIAAPASFWYLKAFPIAKMSAYLDYIVYMTYDLHGQWDAGNQFSIDGCPAGNCLRSHVNLTETMQVLAMITKAGVQTSKIFVGESSYGRSFGMSDPSCASAMCTFTGGFDASTAEPGMCTATAGYISNAEIYTLLDLANNATTWYDTDSNSDIMTWDNGNWVAFMSESTKSSRRSYWQGFNFRGTIDWAVDLQNYADEGAGSSDSLGDDDTDYLPPGDIGWGACTATYDSLEAMDADQGIPFYCSAPYLLQFLLKNLTASMTAYDDLMKNGYDGKFDTYAGAVVSGSSKEVDDFMRNNGNKYFSCVVTETTLCCDKCAQQAPGFPGACTYCFKGGNCCKSPAGKRELLEISDGSDTSSPANQIEERDRPPPPTNGCGVLDGINEIYKNVSEPCPPDYSKRGLGQGDPIADTVYWTLIPDKSDQFYADLYNATGISSANIAFKDINHSECDPNQSKQECQNTNWDIGIPAPNGYDKSDVLNPKDTVSKAYSNLQNLKGDEFSTAINSVSSGTYSGDPMDLVDALSLPIFMISDAIDGMNSVVKVADQIDHEKMMAIVFGFLSAIFFFIPIAGEIAGEVAALAGISRIAALIGAAGNAAMDIYQVVDAKGNAPLAIFDLITAPLALADVGAIAKAAGIRRAMKPEELDGLGKVKNKLDIVDDIKLRGVKRELGWSWERETRIRPNFAMAFNQIQGRGGLVLDSAAASMGHTFQLAN